MVAGEPHPHPGGADQEGGSRDHGHLPCEQDAHLAGGREESALHKSQLDEVTHQQLHTGLIPTGGPAGLKGRESQMGRAAEDAADGPPREDVSHITMSMEPGTRCCYHERQEGWQRAGVNSGVPESSPRRASGRLCPFLWSSRVWG